MSIVISFQPAGVLLNAQTTTADGKGSAEAALPCPSNKGLFVIFKEADGSTSAPLMLGTTDTNGHFSTFKYDYSYVDEVGHGYSSGFMPARGHPLALARNDSLPVQFLKSVKVTAEGNAIYTLTNGQALEIANATLHGNYTNKIFDGLSSLSVLAKNLSTTWREALFSWDEPIPLPVERPLPTWNKDTLLEYLSAVVAGSGIVLRHSEILDANQSNHYVGSNFSVSYRGLMLDGGVFGLPGAQLTARPSTGQYNLTYRDFPLTVQFNPKWVGVCGCVIEGKQSFRAVAMMADINELKWNKERRSVEDSPLFSQAAWSKRISETRKLTWKIQDRKDRVWVVRNLEGYQDGIKEINPKPGHYWVGDGLVSVHGPRGFAPAGGNIAAIDFDNLTVHVPCINVKSIDFLSRRVVLKEPFGGRSEFGLLGFADYEGRDIANLSLRAPGVFHPCAIEAIDVNEHVLSFPVESLKSVSVWEPRGKGNPLDHGTRVYKPQPINVHLRARDQDLDLVDPKVVYLEPARLRQSSDSLAQWLVLGLHEVQSGRESVSLAKLVFHVEDGPYIQVRFSDEIHLSKEGEHWHLKGNGLDFSGDLLSGTIVGKEGSVAIPTIESIEFKTQPAIKKATSVIRKGN